MLIQSRTGVQTRHVKRAAQGGTEGARGGGSAGVHGCMELKGGGRKENTGGDASDRVELLHNITRSYILDTPSHT